MPLISAPKLLLPQTVCSLTNGVPPPLEVAKARSGTGASVEHVILGHVVMFVFAASGSPVWIRLGVIIIYHLLWAMGQSNETKQ